MPPFFLPAVSPTKLPFLVAVILISYISATTFLSSDSPGLHASYSSGFTASAAPTSGSIIDTTPREDADSSISVPVDVLLPNFGKNPVEVEAEARAIGRASSLDSGATDAAPQIPTCIVSGCSGHVCQPAHPETGAKGLMSTCVWKKSYECFRDPEAKCVPRAIAEIKSTRELLSSSAQLMKEFNIQDCAWVVTPKLYECIASAEGKM